MGFGTAEGSGTVGDFDNVVAAATSENVVAVETDSGQAAVAEIEIEVVEIVVVEGKDCC